MIVKKSLPNFCFILGRGRSGTSLLSSILSSHPEVSIAPEGLLIINTINKYQNAVWKKQTINKFLKDVWKEERLSEWKFDKEELEEWLNTHGINSDINSIYKLIYEKYAICNKHLKAKVVGDKNPHNALFANKLNKCFPKAKFIHIARDYRDNILSFQNVPFDLNSVAGLAYRWKKYNLLIEKAKKDSSPNQFLTINYESLITNTQETLVAICNHLNVDFNESMLSFFKQKDYQNYPWHSNLSKPLTQVNINKWLDTMPKSDLLIAESICGNLGGKYGYETKKIDERKIIPRAIIGLFSGWILLNAEKFLFKMPITLRTFTIKYYRFITRKQSARSLDKQ